MEEERGDVLEGVFENGGKGFFFFFVCGDICVVGGRGSIYRV